MLSVWSCILIAHLTFVLPSLGFIDKISGENNKNARKIHIDIGANNGDSVLTYITLMLPNSSIEIRHDRINYPSNDGSLKSGGFTSPIKKPKWIAYGDWEVYAVEANEIYKAELAETKSIIESIGGVQAMHLLTGQAVGTYDGHTEFILDGLAGPGSAGSTTKAESKSAIGKRLSIKMIDIKIFLLDFVKIRRKDFVSIKIDIEGAEYDLLRHMLSHDLLKFIDRIAVEWYDIA
jgi:FkbM family methyltransferase